MGRPSEEYPEDWDQRRKTVYRRDNYTCQWCGEQGGPHGDRELHADHIVPISDGGDHKLDNLQTLCRSCHDDKTRVDTGQGLQGQPSDGSSTRIWTEGEEVSNRSSHDYTRQQADTDNTGDDSSTSGFGSTSGSGSGTTDRQKSNVGYGPEGHGVDWGGKAKRMAGKQESGISIFSQTGDKSRDNGIEWPDRIKKEVAEHRSHERDGTGPARTNRRVANGIVLLAVAFSLIVVLGMLEGGSTRWSMFYSNLFGMWVGYLAAAAVLHPGVWAKLPVRYRPQGFRFVAFYPSLYATVNLATAILLAI